MRRSAFAPCATSYTRDLGQLGQVKVKGKESAGQRRSEAVPTPVPTAVPARDRLGQGRRVPRLLYVRVQHCGDGTSRVYAPRPAGEAIKEAVPADEREWAPRLRCWLVDTSTAAQLRELLGDGFHVRYADVEPRSSLPVFTNPNRRNP